MTTYTDMLGQEISVGDFVVYATTHQRSPVLKYAVVEKVDTVPDKRYVRAPDGLMMTQEYDRVRVGVREIKNGRGFKRWDSTKLMWKEDGSHEWVDNEVRVTYPMLANIVKVTV